LDGNPISVNATRAVVSVSMGCTVIVKGGIFAGHVET
jgi:hypothetical protein